MVGLFDIFRGEGLGEKRSNGQKTAGLPEGRVKMESKKVRICAIFHLKTCGLRLFGLFCRTSYMAFAFVSLCS